MQDFERVGVTVRGQAEYQKVPITEDK